MRLREFLDHLGIVLLVLFVTTIYVLFMLYADANDAQRGPPPMFEEEQWEELR